MRVEDLFRLAGDVQKRNSVRIGDDLDVMPRDLAAPACLQRFQKCFFRRKASGVRLPRRRAFAFAIRAFVLCEHAIEETRSSGYRIAYAIDFNNIDAG